MNKLIACSFAALLFAGCLDGHDSNSKIEVLGISKWYQGRTAVYTPNEDTPSLNTEQIAWLISQGLSMDLELISDLYMKSPGKVDTLRDSLVPKGFGYFGHGHTHINHDALDYDSAYSSYRINFEYMKSVGLKPVSYAYPGGYGHEPETHRALQNAGFLSGRLAWQWSDEEPTLPHHVMPGDEKAPRNWYMLPALYMQDIGYAGCEGCVNNHTEFAAYLDNAVKERAWLISVYHAIGMDGKQGRPLGWGYYDLENFKQDMLLAKSLRDQGILWLATLDAVTLYTMERNATKVTLKRNGKAYDLRLANSLDKVRFDHPLTVMLSIPKGAGKRVRITKPGESVARIDTLLGGDRLNVDLQASDTAYSLSIL